MDFDGTQQFDKYRIYHRYRKSLSINTAIKKNTLMKSKRFTSNIQKCQDIFLLIFYRFQTSIIHNTRLPIKIIDEEITFKNESTSMNIVVGYSQRYEILCINTKMKV